MIFKLSDTNVGPFEITYTVLQSDFDKSSTAVAATLTAWKCHESLNFRVKTQARYLDTNM